MKMTIFWLGLLCLSLNTSFAQTDLTPQIRAVFEQLDKTAMQTEFLIDQGYHFVQPDAYDGLSTSDSIGTNKAISELMYSGLMTSREYYYEEYINLETIDSIQNIHLDQDLLPLGLVNMQIDKMNLPAFENGTIYQQGDQLYNVSQPTTALYTSGQMLFIMPGSKTVDSASVDLIIPKDLFITNNSLPVTLEFKGPGQPDFVPVLFDTVFTIHNLNEGENLLVIRITQGQDILLCRAVIEYQEVSNMNNATSREYSDEPESFDGVEGVELFVYFDQEDTDCGANQISKPLIFVEGFDPNNIIGIKTFEGIIDKSYNLPSSSSLKDELEQGGYDLIFVNWKVGTQQCNSVPQYSFNNGEASLLENAERIKEVLRWVNAKKKAAGSAEQNILIGASMGGVVSKLALHQLEAAAADHECRLFVGFDAPLKGANIPLGLQALVYDFNELKIAGKKLSETDDLGPSLRNALHSISSPAARELVHYHYAADQQGLGISYWHDELFDLMDSYDPLKVEHLAIANGAKNGVGQLFDPGTQLMDMSKGEDELIAADGFFGQLAATMLKFVTNIYLDVDIWAYSSTGTPVYSRAVSYKILEGFPVYLTVVDAYQYWPPAGLLELDAAPGGMRPFNRVAEGTGGATPGAASCPAPGEFGLPFLFPSYCFVPTFSALDAEVSDPYFDFSDNTGAGGTTAGNDFYVGPELPNFMYNDPGLPIDPLQVNQEHVYPDNDNMNFMVFGMFEDNSFGDIETLTDRTYNFGKADQNLWDQQGGAFVRRSTSHIIDHGVVISDNGKLWINKDGRIGFTDLSAALYSQESDEFTVQVQKDCDLPTIITVEDNGRIEVGEPWQNEQARLVVNAGNTVIINAAGLLKVNDHSTLEIKSGGRVIVNAGGELQARSGKIEVQRGGILQLNTDAEFVSSWAGELIVQEGGTLQIDGAKIELQGTNGAIHVHGLLKIVNSFTFEDQGYFKFYSSHAIEILNDWAFTGSSKFSKNIELNFGTTLDLTGSAIDFNFTEIKFNGDSKIKMNGGSFLSTAVNFKGFNQTGLGLELDDLSDIKVKYSNFEDLEIGMSILNYAGNNVVNISISEFNNCENAVVLAEVSAVKFNYSTIEEVVNPIVAINTNSLTLTGTQITNGLGAYGVYLSNVDAFSMYGSRIDGWLAGIYCPFGAFANVFLHQAYIQNNTIGVHIEKGASSLNETHGLVLADCAKFINNGTAIKGEDLTLKVDAIENCNNCPVASIAPNTFDLGTSGHTYFDICFVDNDNTELRARGNYWGGVNPSNFNFHVNSTAIGSGCVGVGSNIPVNTFLAFEEDNGCNGFTGPEIPSDPTELESCPIEVHSSGTTAYEDFHQGYSYYRNEQFEQAYPYFQAVANVAQSNRNNSDFICRHYIDVSRAIVRVYGAEGFEAVNAEITNAAIISDQYIASPAKDKGSNFRIFPNPAKENINIFYKSDDSGIGDIYNAFGQLLWSQSINSKAVINVDHWPDGVYYIILRTQTGAQLHAEKIIVTK